MGYRILRRFQRSASRGEADGAVLSPHVSALADAMLRWAELQPDACVDRARAVVAGTFNFLNHAEQLSAIDWERRYVSHLWNYNLHYFDYGTDLAIAWRRTNDAAFVRRFEVLASDWIGATHGESGDGWEPYALSQRIVNWTYALLLFGDAVQAELRPTLLRSLHRQVEVLSQRLEWHIMANHLQKNLHALLVGSLLFEGQAAERWKRIALKHLWRELDEQVLPDGGHFERAPMYHAIALADFLEDFLLLAAVGHDAPLASRERVRRMVAALHRYTRPNGELHLFNDSAEGIAKSSATLFAMAGLVFENVEGAAPSAWALPFSGYHGLRIDSSSFIIDCGEPGPRYQPGHAHCDVLSYELDVDGIPLIVDSGVHGYGGDPFREFVRSTRAHNTVVIGGREQSEVWSNFRMARRATILEASSEATEGGFSFRGAYRPFHGRGITHIRSVVHSAGTLEITDTVKGARGLSLDSYIHLHPALSAELSAHTILVSGPAVRAEVEIFGCDNISLVRGVMDPVQGWFCPEFGVARPNSVVVMHLASNTGAEFGYRVTWSVP